MNLDNSRSQSGRMLFTIRTMLFLTLFIAILLVPMNVRGHGMMIQPKARNVVTGNDCPQCLAMGGPGLEYEGGTYRHGMCGNKYTDSPQNWNVPGPTVAQYTEGDVITITVQITAHHLGYFAVSLCDQQFISEECFARNRLMRPNCIDPNNPNCYRAWKQLASHEISWIATHFNYNGPKSPSGTINFSFLMRLPTGVSCTDCVLRWQYYSTNSCQLYNPAATVDYVSEEFMNCADVTIYKKDNLAGTLQTKASAAQIEILKNDVPRDLYSNIWRPKKMYHVCPERSLGFSSDYDPATSLSCFYAAGETPCKIAVFSANTPTQSPIINNSVVSTALNPSRSSIKNEPVASAVPNPSTVLSSSDQGLCVSANCKGCLWLVNGQAFCFSWPQLTCDTYKNSTDSRYVFCSPLVSPIVINSVTTKLAGQSSSPNAAVTQSSTTNLLCTQMACTSCLWTIGTSSYCINSKQSECNRQIPDGSPSHGYTNGWYSWCGTNVNAITMVASPPAPAVTSLNKPVVNIVQTTGTSNTNVNSVTSSTKPILNIVQTPAAVPNNSNSATTQKLIDALANSDGSSVFQYQLPNLQWTTSDLYKWKDMVDTVSKMINVGVGDSKLWNGGNNYIYGLVGIAAFLGNAMEETIKYNACDENNWSGDDVARATGSSSYASTSACGQLAQSYQDYTCNAEENDLALKTSLATTGVAKPMACDIDKNMELRANTQAKWYGAPPPLFCAPKSKIPIAPKWNVGGWCQADPAGWGYEPYKYPLGKALPDFYDYVNKRGMCKDYPGQQAGFWESCTDASGRQVGCANPAAPGFNQPEGRTDLEGCCWWGRGVIQTTGVCNFGKLNYYMGARAKSEGRASLYPNVDFCKNPGIICEPNADPTLKWVAGFFYHLNSIQSYSAPGWDYYEQLKKFVDGGINVADTTFIDGVSGIVNRGCHNPPNCPSGTPLHGGPQRADNFKKVLKVMKLIN